MKMIKHLNFEQIRQLWVLFLWLVSCDVTGIHQDQADEKAEKCGQHSVQLKYTWGDALTDTINCLGHNNIPYPSFAIDKLLRKSMFTPSRSGRSSNTIDPSMTRQILLRHFEDNREENEGQRTTLSRMSRNFSHNDLCLSKNPGKLCKTRYNTTAPMYGVSLTSSQPVTIVQKFPDLLQQVVYELCESTECDMVKGECTQTYVPYLFLIVPLGPVTLTGQDYVLVESGCVCKPKPYSNSNSNSNSNLATSDTIIPLSAI